MKGPLIPLSIWVCIVVSIGCATVQKNYGSRDEGDDRPQLRQSLLKGDQPLSEVTVQKILSSRVSLPKTVNLAIIRLADSNDILDFQTIDQEIAEKFYDKSNWGSRVKTIIPMPQMMISRPMTLATLRQAAVLLQADALLIIKPVSRGGWKFNWFDENKAKSVTSLEVLLLDTRTSIVPFTQVITETAEVERQKKVDYDESELLNRAKKASESKALFQVAPTVGRFISKMM